MYEKILDTQPHGIAKFDSNGNYLYFNSKELSFRGLNKKEAKSICLFDLFSKKDQKKLKKRFLKLLNNKKTKTTFEYKNGSRFFQMILLKDEDKNIITTLIDITKQKKFEEQKQIALTELLENIAHHYRQPLTTISAITSGISMQKELDLLDDTEFDNACDDILETTKYLSSILESFKTVLQKDDVIVTFNVKKIVEENYDLLFGDAIRHGIEVLLNIDDDLIIKNSSSSFIQVLLSLILNSQDALENVANKKMIILNISKENKELHIEFIDSAGGIPNDIINRVFEPYFTTKHKVQGKGLGLYTVRNIINNYFKGDIFVQNSSFEYNNSLFTGAKFDITYSL